MKSEDRNPKPGTKSRPPTWLDRRPTARAPGFAAAILYLLSSILAAPGAHLQVISQDLAQTALPATRVSLTPLNYPSNNLALVSMGSKSTSTDSNGVAWFSNALPALYRLDLGGTPPTSFRLLV